MTILAAAAFLALGHVSIVTVITLVARQLVSVRSSAARATVGTVGMGCILAVTFLAALPVPGIWPSSSRPLSRADSHGKAGDAFDAHPVSHEDSVHVKNNADAASSQNASSGLLVPIAWLSRWSDRWQQAATMPAGAKLGWRGPFLVLVTLYSAMGVLRLLLALWWVRRWRSQSTLINDLALLRFLDKLRERCGCQCTIEVRQSSRATTPATFGWRKPVILLPVDWSQWTTEELLAVLAHEVAHVARRDFVQRFFALGAAAVHFYHPLVHAAARRVAIDQELAADQLARELMPDGQSYARGLASLALRYHNSFSSERFWSSVSIMPRSADFLARRLKMLRVKDSSLGVNRGRTAACSVSALVMALTLSTALLRSAAADVAVVETAPQAPFETPESDIDSVAAGAPGGEAATTADLFHRTSIDPATLRFGKYGGFLIRVGEMLRHPEVQPHVEALNHTMSTFLQDFIGDLAKDFDLRAIDWIAGDLIVSAKPPEEQGGNARFMFGSGAMIIRTTQAADWQKSVLDGVPGSTLKTFAGKSYVQFPVIPSLGAVPLRMRSPDEHTLVYGLASKEENDNAEAETKALQRLFADSQPIGPLSNSWEAVSGGLIALVFDNREVGWSNLPQDKREYPEFVAPLFEKTTYVSLGLDWGEKSNSTGVRMRATCADKENLKDVHLAAMTALSYWPALLLENGDGFAPYHRRILQFFASVKIQPHTEERDAPYVEATADATWNPQEFMRFLNLVK